MTTIDRAKALLKSGDQVGAQKVLLPHLKENPNDIEAVFLLAQTTADRKQKQLCYERVIAIDPGNIEARATLKKMGVAVAPLVVEKTPEQKIVEAQQLSNVGSSITRIGCILLALGISLPCLVLIIGGLLERR